jgi:predicted dehydrogenase
LPFKWRGFWDFGTGAVGDMGCHNMDLAFWSLDLRDPVSAEATFAENFEEIAPAWAITTINFPKRGKLPACKLMWYEAGQKPDPMLANQKTLPRNGTIMIGSKDTLYVPHYWGPGTFKSGAKIEDFSEVPVTLPRMAGSENEGNIDANHHQEWIAAIKASRPEMAMSNFDYAGPMTEAVLLGNIAVRAGKKVEWDAKTMTITNDKDANRFVRDEYRKGWEIDGMV